MHLPSNARRFPIGAEIISDATVHFRVWAPRRARVQIALSDPGMPAQARLVTDLQSEGNGYFSGHSEPARVGMHYGFHLDGGDRRYADPASRFQPQGPDGPSQIVDPSQFIWHDQAWKGLTPLGQVLYETHIGTFTQEGTYAAAMNELPELARIGITTLQLMPLADFPNQFGWGYDGVSMFAPTRLYGQPDDLRRLIDRAHELNLGVILDVVYNHFGNVDNYLWEFSHDYNTHRYHNEWAAALNFDGENSGPVREFFIANARYWIDEFHFDGFRFDATHTIHDASEEHILAAISRTAREAAPNKSLYLIAEDLHQDVGKIRSHDHGGYGMDAILNDDFHHTARVRVTGHNSGYYSDYEGTIDELTSSLKRGFLYQGQLSLHAQKPRGTPTFGEPATVFVHFLQNHDQVANSGFGHRLHQLTSPGRYRAITALWLLAPQTPLFLQGQEFGSSSPFVFFADYSGSLAEAVQTGRLSDLSVFPELATPEAQAAVPDPTDPTVFESCKLILQERELHRSIYALHIDLLKLRREDAVFSSQRMDRIDAATLSEDCCVARFFGEEGDDRLLLINFGPDFHYWPAPQPLLAPSEHRSWSQLWSSERPSYGGSGAAPLESDQGWHIPGESTTVLQGCKTLPDAAERIPS